MPTGPTPGAAALRAVRTAVAQSLAGLEPGALALVGLSGGADSLALAAASAHAVRRDPALRVGAVCVDHGLQPGSADRSAAAAESARRLGLDPVIDRTVAVAGPGGPEAAARAARHAALAAAARDRGAEAVLLGHTLDDQAETVLLGLARGSGARSLAGMRPAQIRDGVQWLRPLLGVRRADTRAACAAEGLEPWDDPHNAAPAYLRARLRHGALPALERDLGPGVAAALARTADLLRADADALDDWAADALAAASGGDGTYDTAVLVTLPEAVRTRALHRAVLAAGCPAGSVGSGHVRAVDALVADWRGQGPVALPGGIEARRDCGRLAFPPGG